MGIGLELHNEDQHAVRLKPNSSLFYHMHATLKEVTNTARNRIISNKRHIPASKALLQLYIDTNHILLFESIWKLRNLTPVNYHTNSYTPSQMISVMTVNGKQQ